ncbi:hypothetical protein R6Q59_003702 [Mikania micrantha]
MNLEETIIKMESVNLQRRMPIKDNMRQMGLIKGFTTAEESGAYRGCISFISSQFHETKPYDTGIVKKFDYKKGGRTDLKFPVSEPLLLVP